MRTLAIRNPAVILVIATALLAFAMDASAQIDRTGRWQVQEGTPDIFADIVQSGTSVPVVWTQDRGLDLPPSFDLIDLTGAFDQTTLVADDTSPKRGECALFGT